MPSAGAAAFTAITQVTAEAAMQRPTRPVRESPPQADAAANPARKPGRLPPPLPSRAVSASADSPEASSPPTLSPVETAGRSRIAMIAAGAAVTISVAASMLLAFWAANWIFATPSPSSLPPAVPKVLEEPGSGAASNPPVENPAAPEMATVAAPAEASPDESNGAAPSVSQNRLPNRATVAASREAPPPSATPKTADGHPKPAAPADEFTRLIQQVQQHGLDMVVVFDSAGSMQGEIDALKKRLDAIGRKLWDKAPGLRMSLVAYRDEGSDAKADGTPLTSDLSELTSFLQGVRARGGADEPKAVDAGLAWGMLSNTFRPEARKVVLLFGDSPPHPDFRLASFGYAQAFQEKQGGVVSALACREKAPMTDFAAIAQAGGGEAFAMNDPRFILEELVILAFGSKHRQRVVEFFDLEFE
jgi:hypothetical protein